MHDLDFKVPLTLLIVGVIILAGYGILGSDETSTINEIWGIVVQVGLGVGVGLAACYIMSNVMNNSFGELGPASLKLAAVITFPVSIGFLIAGISPPGTRVVALIVTILLYIGLLRKLFQLGPVEVVIYVAIFLMVEFLTDIAASRLGVASIDILPFI